jgi:hypothetical protein
MGSKPKVVSSRLGSGVIPVAMRRSEMLNPARASKIEVGEGVQTYCKLPDQFLSSSV